MPRNGSGQYTAPLSSWNPAIEGNLASPADWMGLLNDLVAALTQSVSADGQTLMTGALNMGGNRIVQLGAPTNAGNALRREQIVKGANIASAETITIPTEGSLFDVTGDSTITEINDVFPGRWAFLRFDAGITLEHSASLLLPGNADITTTAGDVGTFVNVAPAIWACIAYQRGGDVLGGSLARVTIFDTAGEHTYEKPGWLKFAITEVQAGGGGGGRAQSGSGSAEGGGGGGGGYARKLILGADISASESVTVGGGGAGGTAGASAPDGQPGGASSFGSHLSANPGLGGGQGTNSTGNQNATRGVGGTGVGGDINIRGGDGGVGRVIGGIAVLGNRGGSSHLGGSSMSRAGAAYGGGGSGVSIAPTGLNTAGLDGAPGIVVIWEYA